MAAAAAAAASQQAHAPPSSPALTAVRRALGFAALATGSAAAWLTWAKTLDEVDEMVKGLSSLMEPFIIVILGTLIGGIVVSMYLPIFKLGAVV